MLMAPTDPPTVRITTPYGEADLVLDGADRVRVQAWRRRALALSVFRVDYDVTAALERTEGRWTITRLEGRPQGEGKGWDLTGAAERELRSRLPLVVDAHIRALPRDALRAAEIARLQAQRQTLAEWITTARAALDKARADLQGYEAADRGLAAEVETLLAEEASG